MTYNLVGFRNYELIVISKSDQKTSAGKTQWLTQCSCGKTKLFATYQLTGTRPAETCGHCYWQLEHKDAYISWAAMKQRCDYEKNKDYARYGGKGIKYQDSWKIFQNFYRDMGDPPLDSLTMNRLTLDRKDSTGDYTKYNCKWSTYKEQADNRIYY